MAENDTSGIQSGDFNEALGLLTRLPTRGEGRRGVAAGWAWPLAGALVALIAGIGGAILIAIGMPSGVVAASVLALMIVMTGAMHEDGLADCADGFWGGWTIAERLEIMKDSRIGTFGVMALCLSVLARWTAIVTLVQAESLVGPLLATAALSRVPMLALMWRLPLARAGGLSDRTGRPSWETVAMAAAIALLLALFASGFGALLAALVVIVAAAGLGWLALRKISGQTGDVLGAAQQVAEIAALATFAAVLG